jgi:hypothetical protein
MEVGKIETAKIPIEKVQQPIESVEQVSVVKYPLVEDLTFRAYVSSEAEALELLTSIQAIINAVGGVTIIHVVQAIEKKPQLLQQAMNFLPLILK